MPAYDIFHLPALNWITALYFFFGGLAAGSFLLSFWAGYEKENLKAVAKTSAVVAPIALIIGLILLVVHLGRPFQFWRIMVTFKPTSTTSWGSWVLNLFVIVSVPYGFLWWREKGDRAKVLGGVGLAPAIFVGMYTGLLLMQMAGNPLWESALLPWIFLVGGLVSAMAVSVLVLTLLGEKPTEPFFGLKKYICGLVVVELLMVGSELVALYTGPAESVEAANLLLRGQFSGWFIGLQIIVGSVLPLVLLMSAKAPKSAAFNRLVSALLLVGVLSVRFIVVLAGQVSL